MQEAKKIGLDGICFTEHNKAWGAEDIDQLKLKWDFLIFRGVEVDTIEGHILVFGLNKDFDAIIRAHELRELVTEAGGVMIAAHPLTGFRAFGLAELKLSPEQASRRPIFRSVDAVEGFSGRTIDKENKLTQEAAEILNMKMSGGSDAHRIGDLGRCVTIFENTIHSEAELITELKAGKFTGAYSNKPNRTA